tara:strand:- start:246 stop:464 length:219 start_codon:yes stop_codon:yes gene_type:complete
MMSDETTKTLRAYAEQIDTLRVDMLFDESETQLALDRDNGKAVQFFLLALSHLETAHRLMKLAALEHETDGH